MLIACLALPLKGGKAAFSLPIEKNAAVVLSWGLVMLLLLIQLNLLAWMRQASRVLNALMLAGTMFYIFFAGFVDGLITAVGKGADFKQAVDASFDNFGNRFIENLKALDYGAWISLICAMVLVTIPVRRYQRTPILYEE